MGRSLAFALALVTLFVALVSLWGRDHRAPGAARVETAIRGEPSATVAAVPAIARESALLEPAFEIAVETEPAAQRSPVVAEPPAELDPGPTRLVARAVGEDGEALPNARIDARFASPTWLAEDATLEATRLRTDDDGTFEWTPKVASGATWDAALRVIVDGEEAFAELAFELPVGGALDLGDVRFVRPPLVVAGRVVDSLGQGLHRARVEVHCIPDQGATDTFPPEFQWLWGTTARGGAFALREAEAPEFPPERHLELRVTHAGYREARLPIAIGEIVGDVTLVRLGAVEGRLLLPDEWPSGLLAVVARRIDGERSKSVDDSSPAPVRRGGEFRVEGLEPGEYELWLEGPLWIGAALLLTSGVRVAAEGLDVALPPFDVRSEIACTRVRVFDADGTIVRSAGLMREIRRGELSTHIDHRTIGIDSKRGFPLAHRCEGADVVLRVAERLDESVWCEGGSVTVTLRRAPTVYLRFVAADGRAWSEPLNVRCMRPGEVFGSRAEPTEDGARYVFQSGLPGEWSIDVSAVGGSNVATHVGTIDVDEDAAEQEFTLTVPADLVQGGPR